MPDPPRAKKTKEMSNSDRERVVLTLIESMVDGQLPKGKISEVAADMSFSRQTISSIWGTSKRARANGNFSLSAVHKKISQRQGNFKYNLQELGESLEALPDGRRETLRDLAKALSVSTTTIKKAMNAGEVVPHTDTIAPALTEQNKVHPFMYCADEVKSNGMFKDMYDRVHVDEKWFYVDRITKRVYRSKGETQRRGKRKCKHKSHIEKIMFMCAVACPRFVPATNQWWDGKIGIWPFARLVPAVRSSRNRPAGTLEWKGYKVDKTAYRDMMIRNVLPAIVQRWPEGQRSGTIWVQQDNAPCHFKLGDAEWTTATLEAELDVKIYCQPPNSPDLNVLDLGFFNSLQSDVEKEEKRNAGELITKVNLCFDRYDRRRLNNVFLTLQTVMQEVILSNGNNEYEIVHMNKERLERSGTLPVSIMASDNVLDLIAATSS